MVDRILKPATNAGLKFTEAGTSGNESYDGSLDIPALSEHTTQLTTADMLPVHVALLDGHRKISRANFLKGQIDTGMAAGFSVNGVQIVDSSRNGSLTSLITSGAIGCGGDLTISGMPKGTKSLLAFSLGGNQVLTYNIYFSLYLPGNIAGSTVKGYPIPRAGSLTAIYILTQATNCTNNPRVYVEIMKGAAGFIGRIDYLPTNSGSSLATVTFARGAVPFASGDLLWARMAQVVSPATATFTDTIVMAEIVLNN